MTKLFKAPLEQSQRGLKSVKTIWKYALPNAPTIRMPKGAKILALKMQGNAPTLWAFVDDRNELETRVFRVVGTGHVADGLSPKWYVGTWIDGSFVFHLFEIPSS